ncbi:glycerate kinase type-2 family protein [Beijerinckia indica]|uniref:Hydroxypyruvate reductase n=1 Tax=Beijerinckia indica subsp. indica (strain ATCC 9039 / DSM 1715 / NCIMB 8712) TaxID=395963 RepID=B2ICS7_BEII9|nr:glycerate kinase [Beijerinckia indica]ACB95351.1 Hydroxypyruvate reductase [Beijerinckia indica subsp. indica ATCC 9039]
MPLDAPNKTFDSKADARARQILREIFDTAVAAADPRKVLKNYLPEPPRSGRCIVVGAGKSSALMAAALEDALAEAWPTISLSGLVITRYGHAVPTRKIEIVEASHPVPDAAGEAAARRVLAAVQGLKPDDLVIALMSGGGSSLLALPAEGLTLADKQAVNRALLASGATIAEMNIVRKHLSAIKGGRLAAASAPARLVTLAISDIPGDDPAAIASGPTYPDASTFADAQAIVARYGLELPPNVADHLQRAADETPKPAQFSTVDFRLIATPLMALSACAEKARDLGLTPLILGDALEGEAREMGIIMAGMARSVAAHGLPIKAPALLLSGGETTVTISKGKAGRGGRNMEFLLALAVTLQGDANIWALAGDTDGIDGTEDAAGAFITPNTLARAREAGLDPLAKLLEHDSYTLYDQLGDLLRTGPTLTNVNDLRAILIEPGETNGTS